MDVNSDVSTAETATRTLATPADSSSSSSSYWTRLRRSVDTLFGSGSVAAGLDAPIGYEGQLNYVTGQPMPENVRDAWNERLEQAVREYNMDPNAWGEFHDAVTELTHVQTVWCGNLTKDDRVLECYPQPDALNPCEDVMGSQWLRISVFAVVALAVVGNVAVLLVLLSNLRGMTVTKFLMANLALADLCLGLYLLLIAAIDVHSIGEYFNYGYEWQYGFGCQAAGFLTVFASHLSVYTLCAITLERWFAITNAMHLNKRIRMRSALIIQAAGWSYAILMSALPLFGVSNYSSTSICIPMETRDWLDTAYLVVIVGNSGVAFVFIAVCYAQIYRSLDAETRQAHGHACRLEMSVTKRMLLLVFTNFACWAPLAFFGVTALAGWPLIGVPQSKILLVFFYPLNSCADPYLYALMTAQYWKDARAMLGRCGCACAAGADKEGGMGGGGWDNNNTLPMLHTTATQASLPRRRSSSIERRFGGGSASRKTSRDFV